MNIKGRCYRSQTLNKSNILRHWPFGYQPSGQCAFIQKMYSKITAHTKSRKAFFRTCATSFLPRTVGKEKRVWPPKVTASVSIISCTVEICQRAALRGGFCCFQPNFCLTVRLSRRFMTILRLHDTQASPVKRMIWQTRRSHLFHRENLCYNGVSY